MSLRPAEWVSVETLAKEATKNRDKPVKPRSMRRRLLRIHAKHGGSWLERLGDPKTGPIRVSISGLLEADPSFFEKRHATRDEVERLEEKNRELTRRVNALGSKMRRLWKIAHAFLEHKAREKKEQSADTRKTA